jgi:RimJ/RimL family protein N-acetyltransferase
METERLILRLYQSQDRENLISLLTDETVMKHVDTGVYSTEKAESLWQKLITDFYPNGKNTIYAVFSKGDHRYLGHSWIRPNQNEEWEIGYILKTEAWGKGYATEIAQKLVEFGFEELNLDAVFATVDTENLGSIRVLEKVEMKHFRDEYDEQGKFYLYRIKR